MKFLVLATIAAMALGSLFHEDIIQTLSAQPNRSQSGMTAVQSASNLGKAMNDSMQGIEQSIGH